MDPPQPPPPPPGGDLLGQIQELLQVKAAYNSNALPPTARKAALIYFWSHMRTILAANPASVGLPTLDEIAEALINGDEEGAADFFDSLISLVPDRSRQRSGGVPAEHELFTEGSKRDRSPSPAKQQGSILVPKEGSHAIKKLKLDSGLTAEDKQSAAPATRAEKTQSTKKKKTTAAKRSTSTKQSDHPPADKKLPTKSKLDEAIEAMDTADENDDEVEAEALQTELEEFVDFPVSDAAPVEVKRAILKLYKGAHANGVDLVRNAYQWANQRLFYDPDEFPDVHLVHWRWWMASRLAFFMWGLHAPLQGTVAQGACRRKKANAQAERNVCTSFMIETWGWYGTLHRMETSGHRTLYWWGGQPGRNQPNREYTGPLLDDLSALFKKNGGAFLQRLRDVRSPGRLDCHGFKNLPTLLEQTGALNPDDEDKKGPNHRLTDRALARVLLDITRPIKVPPHWAGDITTGIWLKLCQSERIRDLRVTIERELADGSYLLSTTTPYDEKESQVVGVTPLMNFDGSYTALPPLNPIPDWDDKQGLVINLSEDDDHEEGEVVEAVPSRGVTTRSSGGSSFLRPASGKSSNSKSK